MFAIQDEIACVCRKSKRHRPTRRGGFASRHSAIRRRSTSSAREPAPTSHQLEGTDKAISHYEQAIRLGPRLCWRSARGAGALEVRWQVAEMHPQDPMLERIPVLIDKALSTLIRCSAKPMEQTGDASDAHLRFQGCRTRAAA